MRYLGNWRAVLSAGTLAFLVFLARGWLDWRFVYREFTADDDIVTTFITILFYTAVCAVWIWALVATGRERRGGAISVLVLSLLLLVVGGIATFAALCPSPCGTAWPLMEATNWLGIVVGVVAVASAGGRLATAA
jgi:hypothetical protein